MDTVKLKKPLFVNGNYNRTGIRCSCILDREISNGTDTYQLGVRPENRKSNTPAQTMIVICCMSRLGNFWRRWG